MSGMMATQVPPQATDGKTPLQDSRSLEKVASETQGRASTPAIYESEVFTTPAPLVSKASLSADEILARVEVAKLGEASSGEAIDIADVINAGELTDEKRQEIAKALVERHMIDSVDLENRLREAEIKEINFILQDIEDKKKEAILELQSELKEKLKDAADETEREQLINEYAQKMQDATNKLTQLKERRLKAMRDKLKKERLRYI